MRSTSQIAGLLATALALGATSAHAQTATGNLGVSISINAGCTITSVTDVNFGNQQNLTSPVDADGNIGVTCTDGLKYQLDLGNGQNGSRNMKLTNGPDLIPYQLFKDAQRTITFGLAAFLATGNGLQQNYPVYGRVGTLALQPPTGVYTDTVLIAVNY